MQVGFGRSFIFDMLYATHVHKQKQATPVLIPMSTYNLVHLPDQRIDLVFSVTQITTLDHREVSNFLIKHVKKKSLPQRNA